MTLVIRRVLERGWAHHIERLMVLGNALSLLRIHPDEVWRWFMALFVDAYDWVMVPNVYAMSQFAAAEVITTKPYVSVSDYLRTMSDLPRGDWCAAWDGLYWTFVEDHLKVLETGARSGFAARQWRGMEDATRQRHREAAAPWLGRCGDNSPGMPPQPASRHHHRHTSPTLSSVQHTCTAIRPLRNTVAKLQGKTAGQRCSAA